MQHQIVAVLVLRLEKMYNDRISDTCVEEEEGGGRKCTNNGEEVSKEKKLMGWEREREAHADKFLTCY